ncbi:hypothetical protein MHBO_001906 [Bonamia ostreae]|uniref:Trehalose synthase N-terminal domain-containing protein n=1 Tax=Bonamia ostreae TaxID=126728 RepID=A0ABV2AKN1_9EUKA
MRPNNARFMREFNIDGDWAVIDGCEDFYNATVHIHEGIQNPNYSPLSKKVYKLLLMFQ